MFEQLPIGANRLAFFIALAFAVSAFGARALTRIALRIGLADLPGGRKQHEGAVPVTGGLAMFSGFAAAALASGLIVGPTLALVTALGLLVAGGAADDMKDISPRTKFVLQLGAALFMTSWAGVQVTQLGNLLGLGIANLHGWAIPFSIV